jgi:aryl-alcohol dehydrogenase-like predicted oxidoreductase
VERRQFGATDMNVSALGFGGSEIGSDTDARAVKTLLASALDAGLNVVDTSACYGMSEELIGDAISHRRHEYYLFSKCGHASGLPTPDWDPATIRDSIDRSLKRLKTDYLDLIQLHSCRREVLERGEVIDELDRARDAGKVRYVGYSGDNEAALWAVESGRFASLQTSISIADQSVLDAIVPLAHEKRMGIIAKRPVANVAWRMAQLPEDDYGYAYGERLKALRFAWLEAPLDESVATALRFTLSVPGVSTAIVGTRSPGRWQQNAASVALGPLDAAAFEEIRSTWKRTAQPDWMGET